MKNSDLEQLSKDLANDMQIISDLIASYEEEANLIERFQSEGREIEAAVKSGDPEKIKEILKEL